MKRFALFFASLVMVGCATASYTPYVYKPPYGGEVKVYDSAPEGAEKVGVVTIDSADIKSGVSKAKLVAAKNGADGIVFPPDAISTHKMGAFDRYLITCHAIRTH